MQFISFNHKSGPFGVLIIAVLMMLASSAGSNNAQADEMVRLNIAAFTKKEADFKFDPIISGTYAQLFEGMQTHADVIFLNRTPVLRDKDVVNLQEDALRMSQGELSNGGLNCQFSFDNESDDESQFYSIAGMCNLLFAEDSGTRSVRAYIKRTMLSDVNYGMNVWIKIYEDKETGLALYADVDPI